MLPVNISTTDPTSGTEIPIPPAFLRGVHRANAILESELGDLTQKFDISATWQFVRKTEGVDVELDLSSGRSTHVRGSFTSEVFETDESIRRALRPVLTGIGHMLSAMVKLHLELLEKRIQRDLESLATVTGE